MCFINIGSILWPDVCLIQLWSPGQIGDRGPAAQKPAEEGDPTDSAHAQADQVARERAQEQGCATATLAQVRYMVHVIATIKVNYFSCGNLVELGILDKLHKELWQWKVRPVSFLLRSLNLSWRSE